MKAILKYTGLKKQIDGRGNLNIEAKNLDNFFARDLGKSIFCFFEIKRKPKSDSFTVKIVFIKDNHHYTLNVEEKPEEKKKVAIDKNSLEKTIYLSKIFKREGKNGNNN
jgi:hypothetical protein